MPENNPNGLMKIVQSEKMFNIYNTIINEFVFYCLHVIKRECWVLKLRKLKRNFVQI